MVVHFGVRMLGEIMQWVTPCHMGSFKKPIQYRFGNEELKEKLQEQGSEIDWYRCL